MDQATERVLSAVLNTVASAVCAGLAINHGWEIAADPAGHGPLCWLATLALVWPRPSFTGGEP